MPPILPSHTVMLISHPRSRFYLGNDSGQLPHMRPHLFSVLLAQVSLVPAKGVPELAYTILKSLHTLVVVIVGSGRSQHQHGKIPGIPTLLRRVSQIPVDGGNVPSVSRAAAKHDIGAEECCTTWVMPDGHGLAGGVGVPPGQWDRRWRGANTRPATERSNGSLEWSAG